ncbi:MAG: GNAT family N-acetyltransferase [Chloroflexi bacterium]|nr:GNAT family N-acetyltransferase [Chloroflexota bacterium]
MSWNIRPARPEESAAIALLVNSAYRGESSREGWTTEADLLDGQRTDEEAIASLSACPEQTLLVIAGDDDVPVGTVLLERRPGGVSYLGMLTAAPRLQAQGLGRRLIEEAEAYARREWGSSVTEMTVIDCRTELIAWYERRGYVRTGEHRPFPATDPRLGIPKRDDLGFIVMQKRIG